jgi:Ca-activated chloride channel homolog
MSPDPHDPKWTAYVLDELDATARADVERELAASADARRLVDEIRRTTDALAVQLQAEPRPALDAARRSAIGVGRQAGAVSSTVSLPHAGRMKPAMGRRYALAASILLAIVVVGGLLTPAVQRSREAGRRQTASRETTRLEAAKNSAAQLGEAAESSEVSTETGAPGQQESKARDLFFVVAKPTYESESSELDRQPSAESPAATELALPAADTLGRTKNSAVDRTSNLDSAAISSKPLEARFSPGSNSADSEYGEAAVAHSASAPLGESNKPRTLLGRYGGTAATPSAPAVVANEGADQGGGEKPGSPKKGIGHFLSAEPATAAGATPRAAAPRSPSNHFNGPVTWTDRSNSSDAGEQPRAFGFSLPGGAKSETLGRVPRLPESEQLDAPQAPNTEAYEAITDNPFLAVADNPLSTFSIDVDTASYSIVRRHLQQNHQLPPRSAVRIEELVNYFHYDYPQPEGDQPFAANIEIAGCPWNAEHRLVRIGLKGREVARDRRPLSNLVFLVDVSGSMLQPSKLPLVKESLRLLTEQLGENDRVAIVVYAGNSGLVLPSTSGSEKAKILQALDGLEGGGSTNGGQGIQLAYDMAVANFIKGGTNRVILATDGDFNVGITDRGELIKLIEQKAASGVFLTALGYGMGNLKDATLEQLADKGNGNYAYIDNAREAKKVLVEQMAGTLITIAKDVKIQIEFNPAQVAAFRLIGYENRVLAHEDFNNDKKDAGEIGAGHTVTALYELVPAGKPAAAEPGAANNANAPAVDTLKYQQKTTLSAAAQSGELLNLKLRYKQPDGDTSRLVEYPARDSQQRYGQATRDFKFAASVALFGMLLRDSPYTGTASFDAALELAQEGRGSDAAAYRAEFIELIGIAKSLKR